MTDFLQWNPNANNQETDAAYAADAQRSGGAADPSVFASTLANKAFFQWSIFIKALAESLAAKGYSLSDGATVPGTALANLQATLANILTNNDLLTPNFCFRNATKVINTGSTTLNTIYTVAIPPIATNASCFRVTLFWTDQVSTSGPDNTFVLINGIQIVNATGLSSSGGPSPFGVRFTSLGFGLTAQHWFVELLLPLEPSSAGGPSGVIAAPVITTAINFGVAQNLTVQSLNFQSASIQTYYGVLIEVL